MLLVTGCWFVVIPGETGSVAMHHHEPATSNQQRAEGARQRLC
jgi:hypothetical protein